jgi:uncharacterized protein YyaL (SSP411 family)
MIEWLDWDPTAFARAERERKPVLLSITAAWCRACHEMDRTTYADSAVAALVRDRFVAVRVDADRRPDINERYNLGGWPTTAFLTPAGELMTGGTFVPVDRMVGVLARVADALQQTAFQKSARSQDGRTVSGPESEASRPAEGATDGRDGGGRQEATTYTDLLEQTFATFDAEYGGFGTEPKFPHTAPLHLAIALFEETADERWRFIVERTLDAMADGELWDADAGGFRRYATRRDWQLPHHEKLLETNASLLRVYADAARALGRAIDRDRSAAISRFITTSLRSEKGGYYGSDADTIVFVDANAIAARGLLAAASVLGDNPLGQEALESLERVLLACYKPGFGVAHYFDRAACVRGLLTDQVDTIVALLDAHEITDGEPYRMLAEEIGHFVARELWDATDGGCFDRAPADGDIGLLRSRRKPFVGNAEAAVAFARLDRITHEFDFGPFAAGALHAAARDAGQQGPLTAHYLLAARQVG